MYEMKFPSPILGLILWQTLTLADLFHIPGGMAIQGGGCNHLNDSKRPNVAR